MTQFRINKNERTPWSGRVLYRIYLTEDHRYGKAGDRGGWVESDENLSGDAWIGENAKVYGGGYVYGNALVTGSSEVYENARVFDGAEIYGDCMIQGGAKIFGSARLSGNVDVRGNVKIRDEAQIDGDIFIGDIANIGGTAQISGGNIRITGEAHVDGEAKIMGRMIKIYEQAHITEGAIIEGLGDYEIKIYGNTFLRAYKWNKSPLQIQGSRHFFSICPIEDWDGEGNPTMGIKIGCTDMTLESWERDYKSHGENADYTPNQIEEYKAYIKLAIHLYATYGY